MQLFVVGAGRNGCFPFALAIGVGVDRPVRVDVGRTAGQLYVTRIAEARRQTVIGVTIIQIEGVRRDPHLVPVGIHD